MFTSVTIQDANGNDVPLMDGNRRLGECNGLHGLPAPRRIVRPRPGGHGEINETKHYGSRQPVWKGMLLGDDEAELWAEYDTILQALWGAVEEERLLKWTRGARTAATNRVTNPSLETDTTGYTPLSGTALDREPSRAHSGSWSLKLTRTAPGIGEAWARIRVPAEPGEEITFSLHADDGDGTDARIWVDWLNSGGSIISDIKTSFAPSPPWTRHTITGTAPANVTHADIWVGVTGLPQGGSAYADAFMAGPAGDYFDGDTAGYSWAGEPHASTSSNQVQLQSAVKLGDTFDPIIKATDAGKVLAYQLVLDRQDPRNYGQNEIVEVGDPLTDAAGGITYPATYPWQYTPSGAGEVVVHNSGTIPTPVLFRAYGYGSAAQILNVNTGRRIALTGEIANGDYLEVDTFARSVLLNGSTDRTNLVDFTGTDWRAGMAEPGTTTIFRLLAAQFDAAARLDCLYRPAYA